MKQLWPPLLLFLLVVLGLEFFVRQGLIQAFLVPPPSQVGSALLEFQSEITRAFSETARSTLTGFLLSFLIAQSLALILSLSDFARRAVFPFAVFFQTVPIIAIAPLLVIWFGFGSPTVTASSLIVSFFPILSNSLVGLESARREWRELFALLQASKLQTLLKLQIPAGLRSTLAGLRIAAGLAVIGALVGEFVGGGGLGALIDSARTQQRVDLVFACVLLSAVLGLIFIAGVFVIEKAVRKWRPFYES